MSIAVQLLPSLNVIQVSVDGQILFVGRDQCTEFLGKFMRAMAESIPGDGADVLAFPDPVQHSVKVPAVFACQTDESCGAA